MPKLTPEEKKLLRAAKKAEKKRLAAERQRQLKFDHLGREIRYGALTVKRHEKRWRETLIKISVPRMKEDLEYAWHNFERIVDSKDFAISMLMDEIRDAEEQYLMNLRRHSENIDRLVRMFRDRLEEMKEENERNVELLATTAEAETARTRATAEDAENYLKTMLYGLELESKAQEKRVRGEYLSKMDEEHKKNADVIQALKSGLETRLEQLWDVTHRFIRSHEKATAERQKEYLSMKQQDDALQVILTEQLLKIKENYDLIKTLRLRYAEIERVRRSSIDDLRAELGYFGGVFLTLKRRLEEDLVNDTTHLLLLTEKSNWIIKILGQYKEKGKWILTLAAVCRKMETLHEKILPFPIPPSSKLTAKNTETTQDFEDDPLYLFWHRVGEADALKYSISEERDFLMQDNESLKFRIHRFCHCLDCPALPPIKTMRKHSVVDANEFMKKYLKQCPSK